MRKVRVVLILLGFIATGSTTGVAAEGDQAAGRSPRFLVHLLDYLAKDYAGAVAPGGKVLSDGEFHEQTEFAASAVATSEALAALNDQPALRAGVKQLQILIDGKGEPDAVAKLARGLQRQVIEVTHLPVAPSRWPNLTHGQEVYGQTCTPCHGPEGRGDGPGGQALNPKPANFRDEGLMGALSPLQVFNTARLGVPGTAMPPFPALSDDDTWALAFYVVSLRHQNTGRQGTGPFGPEVLKTVATSSDDELRATLPGTPAERQTLLATLRLRSATDGQEAALLAARNGLAKALKAYRSGAQDEAKTIALKAYLEGIEPVEPRLRATDAGLVAELEARMADVRAAIDSRESADQVEAATQRADAQIDAAQALMQHQEIDPTVAFVAASTILLREGFEAVLFILALLGVIRAAGSRRAALWVHGGWTLALGCGVLAWLLAGYLIDVSGAQRETVEAWTSLFAVAVLVVVGFWLHSRTEIGRWNHFLKVKVRVAIDQKRLVGLAAVAFIAVFREALETVLFLRAIWAEGGDSAKAAMTIGIVGTTLLIIAGAWAVLQLSARIPVRKLFSVSAVLMAGLACILMGKGLHSLQETGALSVTAAPLHTHLDLLGIFPTWETLTAQLLVLGLTAGLWMWGRRPSPRLAAAALVLLALTFGGPRARAGEGLFSRVYTTETVPAGHYELEQAARDRYGRAFGFYNAVDFKSEYEYGILDNFQVALYYNALWINAHNAPDDNDPNGETGFSRVGVLPASIAAEFLYRVMSPVTDPIGLAFYLEPEWDLHDPHNGDQEWDSSSTEFRILVQKDLFDDQLILAYNLVLEAEYFRYGDKDTPWTGELDVNNELGAAYRVASHWYAGLEGRNHNELGNFWHHDHSVFWGGGAAHYANESVWATLGVLHQVIGEPNGPDDAGSYQGQHLFLHSHEVWETTVKIGVPF